MAQDLGSKSGLTGVGLGVGMTIGGVSCTGGRPKLALAFLVLGSRSGFVGGSVIRLGVSTTGGLPKVARDLNLGLSGVGEAGVDVGARVVGGLVCSGGWSCVGIL